MKRSTLDDFDVRDNSGVAQEGSGSGDGDGASVSVLDVSPSAAFMTPLPLDALESATTTQQQPQSQSQLQQSTLQAQDDAMDSDAMDSDVMVATTAAMAASPPPAGKKRRTTQPIGNLTNAQKRMLCVQFAQVKMTQQELCVWAKDTFQLAHVPHQSTISKILARATELMDMPTKDLAARRKGLVTHPELDTALCNWVLYMRQQNVKLSGDMIKDKARQLAPMLGLTSTMSFSNGWLGGFKKRHNIRLGGGATSTTTATTGATVTTHGGSSSASNSIVHTTAVPLATAAGLAAAAALAPPPQSSSTTFLTAFHASDGQALSAFHSSTQANAMDDDHHHYHSALAFAPPPSSATHSSSLPSLPLAMRDLHSVMHLYAASDVFCMGETGLLYARSPATTPIDSTGATAQYGDDSNARLTLVLAVNADGSEKLEPLCIGTLPLTPQQLQSSGLDTDVATAGASTITANRPLVQYRDNPRAWMTPVLFQAWLERLDATFRDAKRFVLLLVPAAPSHIVVGLELTHVRVALLPHRCPTPFDAGLFVALKRRYRLRHVRLARDRFDAGWSSLPPPRTVDLFQIDVSHAMRYVRASWLALPWTLVQRCWAATELLCKPAASSSSPSSLDALDAIDIAEQAIETEMCDIVALLPMIPQPLSIDALVCVQDEENAAMMLHCPGSDDADVVASVRCPSGKDDDDRNSSSSNADVDPAAAAAVAVAAFAAAKAANERLLLDSSRGDSGGGTISDSDAAAAWTHSLVHSSNSNSNSTSNACHGLLPPFRATTAQLLASLRVLLPELDRLGVDEHTKSSIRTAFRRLRDVASDSAQQQQRNDGKRLRASTNGGRKAKSQRSGSSGASGQQQQPLIDISSCDGGSGDSEDVVVTSVVVDVDGNEVTSVEM